VNEKESEHTHKACKHTSVCVQRIQSASIFVFSKQNSFINFLTVTKNAVTLQLWHRFLSTFFYRLLSPHISKKDMSIRNKFIINNPERNIRTGITTK
jgi:hypothetical protein